MAALRPCASSTQNSTSYVAATFRAAPVDGPTATVVTPAALCEDNVRRQVESQCGRCPSVGTTARMRPADSFTRQDPVATGIAEPHIVARTAVAGLGPLRRPRRQ